MSSMLYLHSNLKPNGPAATVACCICSRCTFNAIRLLLATSMRDLPRAHCPRHPLEVRIAIKRDVQTDRGRRRDA